MTTKYGVNGTKAFPLVAWHDICIPKYEGGLGITKNNDVNKVLNVKLGSRILTNNDNIWMRIMGDKYVKNNHFSIS